MTEHALPYQESGITTILIQASFILLLNLGGYALDKWIYCGLVGQILIGVAWGMPGAAWLSVSFQEVVVQLGYLGLILIVFEGGLSTSIQALKSHLVLSAAVAVTGICLPMGLSFSLLALSNSTSLQAFAAGSALCSTSLGTTFTVLKTSGLVSSRLGVVITSAAMLDDVVGLVMVQMISILGPSKSSIAAITVIRPIAVSIAFAVLLPVLCIFVVKPVGAMLDRSRHKISARKYFEILRHKEGAFLLHTTLLLTLVTAATYAGTSNLFAAYLAGAAISWYDNLDATPPPATPSEKSKTNGDKTISRAPTQNSAVKDIPPHTSSCREARPSTNDESSDNGSLTCHRNGECYNLFPLSPSVVGCDLGQSVPNVDSIQIKKPNLDSDQHDIAESTACREVNSQHRHTGKEVYDEIYAGPVNMILLPFFFASIGFSIPVSQLFTLSIIWRGVVYALLMAMGKLFCGMWLIRFSKQQPQRANPDQENHSRKPSSLPKPKSLYPASLLGFAMIARGEIGFLVSAIAESNGIFATSEARASSGTSDIFLIVTWAILLCTIVGPVAVGLLTGRVKKLQRTERTKKTGIEDPLGIWGVI
jgi:Kef-type K+ transport system membrane component KefB